MTRILAAAALLASFILPSAAAAEERWALIVSGASGGQKYAEDMKRWRSMLTSALVDRYGFPKENVRVLADETDKSSPQGTAANVRSAVAEYKKKLGREDVLLVVLLGHGTYDGEVAKFNLVGPDLTARDWSTLLAGIPGRVVIVNTTAASFPFLEHLSGPNRIVITATHSAAQKYATVFPEYFVKAMSEASSDLDKNGRTSIFEVFAAASLAVRQHFDQRGQLMTEHALIDDNGDGVGRESEAPGPDGAMARTLYLDATAAVAADNPELAELMKRQRELEAEAEALKLKRDSMPAPEWQAQYEKLMLELARVSREIRQKSSQ
jgi:hypothetical protein